MAIINATYTLNNRTEGMSKISESKYQATARSPDVEGEYPVEVKIYDDQGNVSIVTEYLTVSNWIEPKVNWTIGDRFNIVDFNRIRNNILYLHNLASKVFGAFEIQSMGNSINDHAVYWDVDHFNAFEENIDRINENIITRDYGVKKVFYENGVFIDWIELNRIEGACLSMKKIIEDQAEIIWNIPFRLGAYKEVRV